MCSAIPTVRLRRAVSLLLSLVPRVDTLLTRKARWLKAYMAASKVDMAGKDVVKFWARQVLGRGYDGTIYYINEP